MKRVFGLLAIIVGMGFAPLVSASQTFQVLDHGFGSLQAAGPYGLRVDELGFSGANTFSVQENGASVFLDYDSGAGTAAITGVVASNNADMIALFGTALFGVEYFLTELTSRSDGGFTGFSDPATTASGRLFSLEDDSNIFVFQGQFNNANTPYHSLLAFDGHRISGDNSTGVFRGWLNNDGDYSRDFTNDFLVRVQAVPEPATWLMMIVGFAIVGGALKRRRQLEAA